MVSATLLCVAGHLVVGPVAWCLLVGVIGWEAYRRLLLTYGQPQLQLYQNGMAVRKTYGTQLIYWNQVYEIYQHYHRVNPLFSRESSPYCWSYRLVQRNGHIVRLRGFESIRGLGMRIQHEIAARQLPVALETYRTGYAVRMGRHLTISRDGIRVRNVTVSWDEIEQITIDEADDFQLTRIGETGIFASIPCAQIPNLFILDGILRGTYQEPEVDSDHQTPESSWEEVTPDFGSAGEPHLLLDEHDLDGLHSEMSIDDVIRRTEQRPRRPR